MPGVLRGAAFGPSMAARSSAWRGSASTEKPAIVQRMMRFRHFTSFTSPLWRSPPSLPMIFSKIVFESSLATHSKSSSKPLKTKSSPCTNPMRFRPGW